MPTKTASKILKQGLKDNPALEAAVFLERLNVECARLVYQARKKARLTQKELAARVGTSQAAIARLENSDYGVRTLHMIERIGEVLGFSVSVTITDQQGNDFLAKPGRQRRVAYTGVSDPVHDADRTDAALR